jgi:general stress protein YciG
MNHDTTSNFTPHAGTQGPTNDSITTGPEPAPVAASPAPRPKQRRGFAAMDPRLVAEIASKGGKAAHAAGTAHEFTSDEARTAGRKGGLAPHTKRRATAPKNTA